MKKWLLFAVVIYLLQGCSVNSFNIPELDETKLLITHLKEPMISVVDIAANEVIHEENIDYYIDSYVRLNEEQLIFSGFRENEVNTLNIKTGETTSLLTDTEAISALFLDDQKGILYLSATHTGEVLVFNIEEKTIEKRIQVGAYPSVMALHKELLYILNEDDSTISVLNTETLVVTHTFPVLENPTDFIILEETNEIWVGGHGAYGDLNHHVYVYDLNSGEFLTKIKAGSMPIVLYTDERSNHVFILSHGSNDLQIFNKSSKDLEQQVETGRNPHQMTGDEHFIYITALDGDEMMLINRTDFSIEQTHRLAAGPYGIILGGNDHE